MPKKKRAIHYVQLRTYRQWPNEINYSSYLGGGFHSNIQSITYNIDRILSKKWIDIRRREYLEQLNENYHDDVKNYFRQKNNSIDYKYSCLENQFDENKRFIREIDIREIEIIDYLIYFYQQMENSEKQMYEYRIDLLKYEFGQERKGLDHLFLDQELKELDNQITVLNAMEEEENLQQFIQFKIQKQQIEEQFFKDMTNLHGYYNTQLTSLRSTANEIIHSNAQSLIRLSKRCHHLSEKTRQGKERIDQEISSILILKRKIKENQNSIENLNTNKDHLYDKLNQLKQCSNNQFHRKKSFRKIPILFRRLSILIHNVQNDCQKKLIKIERLLLLINQCERLEFDDEKLVLTRSKIDFHQIPYLDHCRLEFDSIVFDELSTFWKRLAYVQLDISIRMKEKISQKRIENILKKQLKILF